MDWWKPALGAVIVLFAIREMLLDLFNPTSSGALSTWIGSSIFRASRGSRSMMSNAGPLIVVTVIFAWALLLMLGFALIYWSVFPGAYQIKTGTAPVGADSFWWSIYYSLEMMTTLGLGDLQPNPTWLKLLSAFHTLIGFSLVTASITWIVLIFPALTRMRTLARKVAAIEASEQVTGVPVTSAGMQSALAGLGENVITARVDLIHFPVLFYFYAEDRRASLPPALFTLLRISDEGMRPEQDELIQLTSAAIREAVNDFAALLALRLKKKNEPAEAVFKAFAELHSPKKVS
jgi:hypothetical protein